jgi:hypothetical protein
MTNPSSPPPRVGEVQAQAAQFTPPPYQRHPLGLPAGSVRALLALMVFGLIWGLLLFPEEQPKQIPLYLYSLMFLILGHYFAARGHTPRVPGHYEHPPLYLPRGTLRTLFFLGFAGVLGWGFYSDPHFAERLAPKIDATYSYSPLIMLGAFFFGILVNRFAIHFLSGPEGIRPWFQDLLAWVSLLAVFALGAELIIRLVIYPSVEPSRQIALPNWEGFLSALVGFYFGVKS